MKRLARLSLLALLLLTSQANRTLRADNFPVPPNTEPDLSVPLMPARQAARQMQVPDGFRVQVVAAEPDVRNPIAMAWDRTGRLWVAENYTYAERSQRFDLSLRDRVLIFDIDSDGLSSSRTVFTDQVQMLTSVEVGHGGVWLMCPPQLLFIPDGDEDGVPDGPPRTVLDGFTVARNNYHNFANGLRWGPDGWLYGRCGHSCPGMLGRPGTPEEKRIPIRGGMWRYHPRRRIVEVLCHGTTNPWGHDWDQHGELFYINTVNGHLWHVLPGSHFRESFGSSPNPGVYERLDTIADHWHFDTSGQWHESRDGKANEYGGGHAHIGMMIYQGHQWPAAFRNRLFTLNMHGRRTNVERLERHGAGYIGRHQADIFLSADPWFRGLDISTGPDGSAYVLDWSDTGECHEHTGVHRGSGRIYRISYNADRPEQPPASAAVELLTPRCLMQDGRLPELWKRYQAGHTSPEFLREQLRDADEHVRVWAIRLLTDFWPLDTLMGPHPGVTYPDDPATYALLLELAADDPSGLVKLQLASTLQRLPVDRRARLAAHLVTDTRFADDPCLPALTWYGLIPLTEADPRSLISVARNCRWPLTLRWISRGLATRIETSPGTVNQLLESAQTLPESLRRSVLDGLSEAFEGWRKAPQPQAWPAFAGLFTDGGRPDERTSQQLRQLNLLFGDGRALQEIRALALNKSQPLPTRRTALQTLIEARPADLRDICESLLQERGLNTTAARGLAQFEDPAIGKRLAESYHRFDPRERPALLDTLVSRASFAAALLDRLGRQRGEIPPEDLTALQARQILAFDDPDFAERLSRSWGTVRDTSSERQHTIRRLRETLTSEVLKQADLTEGRRLFRKLCASCHRLYGDGELIGPDLTGSQRTNLDYLLQNILDPGAQIAANYRVSVIVLKDGRVLSGIVTSRSQQGITVRTPTETRTVALTDIDAERPSPLSIMPDNLLQMLTPQQQRDLIAYLSHPVQVPLPDENVQTLPASQ